MIYNFPFVRFKEFNSSYIILGGVDGKRSKGEDGGAVMKNNIGVPASDNNRHDLNLPIPNATGARDLLFLI